MSRNANNIISVDGSRRAYARDARVRRSDSSNVSRQRGSRTYGVSSHAVGESISSVRGLDYSQSLSPLAADPFARKERSRFSKVTRSGRIEPLDAEAFDGDREAAFAAASRVSSRPSRSSARPSRGASRIDLSAFSAFDDLDEQLFGSGVQRGARTAANQNARPAAVRPALDVFDPNDADDADELPDGSAKRSKKARRDKAKAKAKAERMFNRQFGSNASANSDAGSRAAVYKGEMGRSHKRAFSDLGGFEQEKASSSRKTSPSKTTKVRHAAPIIAYVIGAFICIAVALVFLYPTAQQFYVESRTQDRLQAEYDQISQRNQAIQDDIDRLSTDEGIQDAAREQLGWVVAGETAGVVEGLSSDGEQSSSSVVRSQPSSEDIKTPETWYSSLLDPLFGYSDE